MNSQAGPRWGMNWEGHGTVENMKGEEQFFGFLCRNGKNWNDLHLKMAKLEQLKWLSPDNGQRQVQIPDVARDLLHVDLLRVVCHVSLFSSIPPSHCFALAPFFYRGQPCHFSSCKNSRCCKNSRQRMEVRSRLLLSKNATILMTFTIQILWESYILTYAWSGFRTWLATCVPHLTWKGNKPFLAMKFTTQHVLH